MEEKHIRKYLIVFKIGTAVFEAEFIPPASELGVTIVDENRWRVSKHVYHKSTRRRPIKRSRSRQTPRLKRFGVFDSLDEVRAALAAAEGG